MRMDIQNRIIAKSSVLYEDEFMKYQDTNVSSSTVPTGSRNSTMMEMILGREDKEKDVRSPKIISLAPRKRYVYVSVEIKKIEGINMAQHMFQEEAFIQAKWREPILDERTSFDNQVHSSSIEWNDLWKPNLMARNLKAGLFESILEVFRNEKLEAFVIQTIHLNGSLSEIMELQLFPFDYQCFSLILMAEAPEAILIEDLTKVSLVNKWSFADEQFWDIKDMVAFMTPHDQYSLRQQSESTIAKLDDQKSIIFITLFGVRKSGFYVVSACSMIILITSLALCTFSVERNLTQNRLQLAFTLILTLVANKFAAGQNLPNISYLTLMDKYMVLGLVIIWSVCVWHAVSGVFPSDSWIADLLDKFFFVGFCVVVFLKEFCFLIYVLYKKRRIRKWLRVVQKDYYEKIDGIQGKNFHEKKQKDEATRRRRQNQTLNVKYQILIKKNEVKTQNK